MLKIPKPVSAAAATVASAALVADLLVVADVKIPHIESDPYIPPPTIGHIVVSSTSASAYTPSIRLDTFVPGLRSISIFKLN